MFKGSLIISEEPIIGGEKYLLEITVVFGDFLTEHEAEAAAAIAKTELVCRDSMCVKVSTNQQQWFVDDSGVSFKILKSEKAALMGRPLDPSNPDDFKIFLTTMDETHPNFLAYTITEDDFEPYEYSLIELAAGMNKSSLDCIAYGYEKVG